MSSESLAARLASIPATGVNLTPAVEIVQMLRGDGYPDSVATLFGYAPYDLAAALEVVRSVKRRDVAYHRRGQAMRAVREGPVSGDGWFDSRRLRDADIECDEADRAYLDALAAFEALP